MDAPNLGGVSVCDRASSRNHGGDNGMSKAALSVEDFCKSYGIGRTTAYEEINSGRLRAVKAGRRTLIPEQSADDWLKSLEPASACAERVA